MATALRTLALLSLMGSSIAQSADCSYIGLLTHLNLTPSNDLLSVMRPVKLWTTPTIVFIDMIIYGILEVDEKSQTVTSHTWTVMRWENEFLTWNISDFCGIDSLYVPRSRVWIPDVQIMEDASDSGTVKASPQVSLYPDGSASVGSRQRITITCQMNLSLFPFDTQHCNMTFASMNYPASSIVLGTLINASQLMSWSEYNMVTQGEWQLENLQISLYDLTKGMVKESRLTYMITIKRKPMLYIVILIVPLFYLLILDLASFFIHEARGEKLSFKVTVLLSISVLLLILKDMLPSTEDTLPMIANFCVAIFALVGLSVLEAMLVSFISDLDTHCYYYWQKTVKSSSAAKEEDGDVKMEVNTYQIELDDNSEGQIPAKSTQKDPLLDENFLKMMLEEVRTFIKECERRESESKTPGRFQKAAQIIDTVFFFLYFTTVTIFVAMMYTLWTAEA